MTLSSSVTAAKLSDLMEQGISLFTTRGGILVKIVFVRNRDHKTRCLYLLSTDCSLLDAEIVRIYGNGVVEFFSILINSL